MFPFLELMAQAVSLLSFIPVADAPLMRFGPEEDPYWWENVQALQPTTTFNPLGVTPTKTSTATGSYPLMDISPALCLVILASTVAAGLAFALVAFRNCFTFDIKLPTFRSSTVAVTSWLKRMETKARVLFYISTCVWFAFSLSPNPGGDIARLWLAFWGIDTTAPAPSLGNFSMPLISPPEIWVPPPTSASLPELSPYDLCDINEWYEDGIFRCHLRPLPHPEEFEEQAEDDDLHSALLMEKVASCSGATAIGRPFVDGTARINFPWLAEYETDDGACEAYLPKGVCPLPFLVDIFHYPLPIDSAPWVFITHNEHEAHFSQLSWMAEGAYNHCPKRTDWTPLHFFIGWGHLIKTQQSAYGPALSFREPTDYPPFP